MYKIQKVGVALVTAAWLPFYVAAWTWEGTTTGQRCLVTGIIAVSHVIVVMCFYYMND